MLYQIACRVDDVGKGDHVHLNLLHHKPVQQFAQYKTRRSADCGQNIFSRKT